MPKSNKQKKQEIKEKRSEKRQEQSRQIETDDSKETLFTCVPNYLSNFDIKTARTSDHSSLSVEMQDIIKDAYVLFSHYSVPTHFEVCTYCCMAIEEEIALRTLPLAFLPKELIYSYNDSAKGKLDSKDEVAYLLPRILELIAHNEEIRHSTELTLDWLAQVPSEQWSQQEKTLLQQFALQYVKDAFTQVPHSRIVTELDEILIMFNRGGINIQPILDHIAQCTDFYSIAAVAHIIGNARNDKNYISNVFIDYSSQLDKTFNHWLEKNIHLLEKSAANAILHPQNLFHLCSHNQYYIEQGLCELSSFTYKHLMYS